MNASSVESLRNAGGGRDHRQRPSRRDVLDAPEVLREDAPRTFRRRQRLAVEQLQRNAVGVVVVRAHAECPDGLQQRVHLVYARDERVRGVLGQNHLSPVPGVRDGGDEVHALAAENGVVRVPVRALAPRPGWRRVHAHAHARPAENHILRVLIRDGGELRHGQNFFRPVVIHELVLRPEAELRRGHRRRERDLERVALRVNLVPGETLDALTHHAIVRLLHEHHRARRLRRRGRAALDVREHQHLRAREGTA